MKLIISQFFTFQRSVLHVCSSIISCLGILKYNIYLLNCILVPLNIFLCKYEQLTINAPLFKTHSIADDFRPIPPKIKMIFSIKLVNQYKRLG